MTATATTTKTKPKTKTNDHADPKSTGLKPTGRKPIDPKRTTATPEGESADVTLVDDPKTTTRKVDKVKASGAKAGKMEKMTIAEVRQSQIEAEFFSRKADREFSQTMWVDVKGILGDLSARVPALVAQYVGPTLMQPFIKGGGGIPGDRSVDSRKEHAEDMLEVGISGIQQIAEDGLHKVLEAETDDDDDEAVVEIDEVEDLEDPGVDVEEYSRSDEA